MASKDLQEVVVAANEVGLHLIKGIKLGLYENFAALIDSFQTDDALQEKLFAAYEGVSNLPAEIASLSFFDQLSLAKLQLRYIGKFVEAVRATKPDVASSAEAKSA